MSPSRDGAEFVPVDGEPAGSSYQAHMDAHDGAKMGSQQVTMNSLFNDSLKSREGLVNKDAPSSDGSPQTDEAKRAWESGIWNARNHGEHAPMPSTTAPGMASALANPGVPTENEKGEVGDNFLNRLAKETAFSDGRHSNDAKSHTPDGESQDGMDVDTTTKDVPAHDGAADGRPSLAPAQTDKDRPPKPHLPTWMQYDAYPPVSSANIPAHLADNDQAIGDFDKVLQRVPERPIVPNMFSPWTMSPDDSQEKRHRDTFNKTPTTSDGQSPPKAVASTPTSAPATTAQSSAPSVQDLRRKDSRKSHSSFDQYRRRQSWNTVGSNAWEQTLGDVHSVLPCFNEPSKNVQASLQEKDHDVDGGSVSAAPKTKEASTALGISENVDMPGLIPGDQIPLNGYGTSPEDEGKFEPRYCTIADDEYAVLASAAAYATAAMTCESSSEAGSDHEEWKPLDHDEQEEVAAHLRAWAGLDGPKRQAEARQMLQQTNDKYRVKVQNDSAESPKESFSPSLANHYQTQLHSLTDNYFSRMQHEPRKDDQQRPSRPSVDMSELRARNAQLMQDEKALQAHFSSKTHPEEATSTVPMTNSGMSAPSTTSASSAPVTTSAPEPSIPATLGNVPQRRPNEDERESQGQNKKPRRDTGSSPTKTQEPSVPATTAPADTSSTTGASSSSTLAPTDPGATTGATSASTPAISLPAYSDTNTQMQSLAFPSQGPPQVPISGWSSEMEAPVSPLEVEEGAEDPIDLLSASAYASGLDIKSPQVRDELLQYAHHLYSVSVALGSKEQQEEAQKTPRRASRSGTKLHPTLLPLLHALHKLHPDHLPTLLLLSCTYYTSGNIPGSLWYNNLILRIDPNYVEAMSNIGTALRALGYWKEAESWWWHALQLLPGYWDAFENLLGVLCSPAARGPSNESRPPQFETALRLCDFVEAHVITMRNKIMPTGDEAPGRVLRNFSLGMMEPQILPQRLPITQLPRVQNLFYAKGNLKYVLEGHGVTSAAEEYQRAVEVVVSVPGKPGYTVRDVIIAVCVVAMLSFGAVVPGHDPLSTAAEIGKAFGIDISNPAYAAVAAQGQYTRLHPEGILGLVRDAGDAAVAALLRIGGKQLPVVFLLPDQVVLLYRILFAPTNGVLPVFSAHAGEAPIPPGSPLETVYRQSSQIGSTILLALAKLFQDAATNPETGNKRLSLRGIPPSISLLLPFYYLSLSMNPSASTFNNLGILLSSLPVATTTVGLSGERVQLTGQLLAVRYYAHGLQLDPTHSHLFTNLGSLFKDMGRLNEAIKMYEKAVEYNPSFDVALANLGNAIKDQGRTQDSIKYYRRSVQANPHFPEALCGLVNALLAVCDWGDVYSDSPMPKQQGWMRDVTNIVERQLDAGTAYGRGAFHAQGTIEQWVDRILKCLGDARPEQRERWTQKLLPFYDPGKHKPHMNEGGFMMRIIERMMRRTQHRWYHDLYTRKCTNENESGTMNNEAYGRILLPSCLPIPSIPTVLPFHTFTYPLTPRQVRLISHRNALRTSHSALSQMWLPKHVYPPPPPPPDGKLNIGYVSSDFNNHPLAHLMQSVFGFHDLSRFNIFCYATTGSDSSPYRKKIEKESQHFLDVSSWSSEKIIQQIQHDKIHILVNLNGYTKGARNDIFAPRPCPVQMQFMGFAGGMASGWTDWLVVDPIVCPPSMTSSYRWREGPSNERQVGFAERPTDIAADLDPEDTREDWVYTERFIYMPKSYFVNDHAQGFRDPAEETRIQSVEEEKGELSKEQKEQDVPVQNQLPDEQVWEREELRRWRMRKEVFPNLPDDYVIFADFNQLYKTDPTLFHAWLQILERVPKSILWLLRFPASGQAHLHNFAMEHAGPDVARRVIFTDVAPKHIHIYRGRIADLFLDTNECNAHTTAADILWSGTPMLTWPKHIHKMCSRVAASILRAADIDKRLVVDSEQEYVDRAVELANSIHYVYEKQVARPDGKFELQELPHEDPDVPPSKLSPEMLQVNCTEEAVKSSMRVPEKDAVFRRGSGELIDLRRRLFLSRDKCPLFNTRGWTRALEAGYREAFRRWEAGTDTEDSPEWEALPRDAPEKLSGHIWLGDY